MSPSPLDAHREKIERWTITGWSKSDIARELAEDGIVTSRDSIRRALRRWGVTDAERRQEEKSEQKPTLTPEQAETRDLLSKALSGPLPDHNALLVERGLDPDEWSVENVVINEWDGPSGLPLKQLKVHCRKKVDLDRLTAARIPGDYKRSQPQSVDWDYDRLVVFCGDQQAPHVDDRLHGLFCQWLEENRPEQAILIGDTIDLPTISRHPAEPEWAPTVQECIDSGYQIIRDYVQSSESTHWTKLAGNHDERLRRAIINHLPELYRLRRAGGEDKRSIFDPAYLLRLDELGVEYIEAQGSYEHAQAKISPMLAARHGWIARKGSGASALATLNHLGYSVVVGHTHRQSHVHQTVCTIDGNARTLAAVETGCMCDISKGLGYAVAPDWQNGFATATVWPDGTFKLDLATYVNNTLYWRDQRFS